MYVEKELLDLSDKDGLNVIMAKLKQVRDPTTLGRIAGQTSSKLLKHACIARIDDLDVLRQLGLQTYDTDTRNKIRRRAQDLYYKTHKLIR